MKTHTVFTLLDGTRHDTIEKAKEHCLEQMGAETRNMLVDIACGGNFGEYKAAIKLVSEKKYDKEILLYVAWRKEHDELELYDTNIECDCEDRYED